MRHEGQRSVAELGAILWYAMGGPDDAPELVPWMARAHADPIVALTLSRQRLGEYAVPEPIDRNTAFPGPCVWLIEIERANKGKKRMDFTLKRRDASGCLTKLRMLDTAP